MRIQRIFPLCAASMSPGSPTTLRALESPPLQNAPLQGLPQDEPSGSEVALLPDPKRKQHLRTLQELLTAHPEIAEVLLDATEQSVPQPEDKLKRKQVYSSKQQDHIVKTQIVATRKTILHIFGGLPGCINDRCVLRASRVLRQVPPKVRVRLDQGYTGADTACPDVVAQQPLKKRCHQEVTVLERAYNHALSVLCIPVEHHFARLEKWGCLAHTCRGKLTEDESRSVLFF